MDVGAQTSLSVFEACCLCECGFFSFGERFGRGRKEVFVRARDGASLWLLLAPFLVSCRGVFVGFRVSSGKKVSGWIVCSKRAVKAA